MSGYWDALLGAAHGTPDGARPSLPSPFAVDDGLGLEVLAGEVEAPALAASPVAPAAPTLAPVHSGPDAARPPAAPAPAEAESARPPQPHAMDPIPLNAPASIPGEPPSPSEALSVSARSEAPAESVIHPPAAPADFSRVAEAVPAEPTLRVIEVERAPGAAAAEPLPAQIAVESPAAASPVERSSPPIETVRAEPVGPEPTLAEPQPEEEALSPLVIEIGQIDVRIVAPEPPRAAPPKRAARAGDVPSLADYLTGRGGAAR